MRDAFRPKICQAETPEDNMFDTELAYFIKNQDELVRRFAGTVLVIRGNEIAGAYPTPMEAYLAAKAQYAPGTYMLQPCAAGAGAYTVMIGSDAA